MKKATINRLDTKETWELGKWIEANQEDLRAQQLTCPEIARLASTVLKFPVTETHVNTVRKAIDVRVGEYKERKPAPPPASAADDDIAHLARAFIVLCEGLGLEPSPRVRSIAERSLQRPLALEGGA